MNGWTMERRQQQAKLIKQWKPWLKSTGPKSEAGKQMASQNARKHGMRSEEIRFLEKFLGAQARAEREARKMITSHLKK